MIIGLAAVNPLLRKLGESEIREPQRPSDLVRRPALGFRELLERSGGSAGMSEDALTSVEVELKYVGYLERERAAATRLAEMASFRLPADMPYLELASLATEARQKLDRVRPGSLAQAGRIPGVSPSDLHNLILEVARRRRSVA